MGWKKFLKWWRNFNIRKSRTQGVSPLSMPVARLCPNCNSKLRQLISESAAPQIYVCRKCGYTGSVFVKPKKKVKKK